MRDRFSLAPIRTGIVSGPQKDSRPPSPRHAPCTLAPQEAAVHRPQRSRRGSRPRTWGSASREPPARPRRVTPLARAHRKNPPCALATVAPRLPPAPVGECIASAPPARPRGWGSPSRSAPSRPHRVTPLARLHRDEAAVLRPQWSRRGSRPREWHVQRGRPHTPSLASRPLHARTAMKPPCSRQRARRFPPRDWHAHRGTTRPPPALAASRPLLARGSLSLAASRRNGRAAAPAPAGATGRRDDHVPSAALRPGPLTLAGDGTTPPALRSASTRRA
jgi:hypothetical protein